MAIRPHRRRLLLELKARFDLTPEFRSTLKGAITPAVAALQGEKNPPTAELHDVSEVRGDVTRSVVHLYRQIFAREVV